MELIGQTNQDNGQTVPLAPTQERKGSGKKELRLIGQTNQEDGQTGSLTSTLKKKIKEGKEEKREERKTKAKHRERGSITSYEIKMGNKSQNKKK